MKMLCGIVPASTARRNMAAAIAKELDCPLLAVGADARVIEAGQLVMLIADTGLSLQETGPDAPGPIPVSFNDPSLRQRRRGGQNELLGRAVGWRAKRAPTVLDGTAGFGRDAFVLADLGCNVHLCERNPVMALLLRRAMDDAAETSRDSAVPAISRLHWRGGDCRELSASETGDFDVIYLDPMFSVPRKAAPGKAMQALQLLTGERDGEQHDGDALLVWALEQAVPRVVVKRPRKAPVLAGKAPSHRLTGRAVRFDVYQR
jgi:16S rRNA (guanine1516-N2)-methyltransferase